MGEAFYEAFKNDLCKFTDKDVNADWLSFLDFREISAYEQDVKSFDPDILIHLGAYTSLEYCDTNEIDALNNNVTSLEAAVHLSNDLIPLRLLVPRVF